MGATFVSFGYPQLTYVIPREFLISLYIGLLIRIYMTIYKSLICLQGLYHLYVYIATSIE